MSKLHIGISFSNLAHVFDIILQQCMGQNHLDLVCGEESPRACMATIPKSQAALVHTDKLVVCRLLNRSAVFSFSAKLIKSQWVEFVGLWEDIGVGADCDSRYLYCHASWDDLAAG